jgi:hypothetical protein
MNVSIIEKIVLFQRICKKWYEKKKKIDCVIQIQSVVRGFLCRIHRLPTFLYILQNYMKNISIEFDTSTDDGRINSIHDEKIVIEELKKEYPTRIQKAPERHWFDMLIFDYQYGWIPVNVKTTTTKDSDNIGNLALLLYSLTSYDMSFKKSYKNGNIAPILTRHFEKKEYNRNYRRDYFFFVLNKLNQEEIIVNSLRGLVSLTPNNNNLPFQVKWSKNK